MNRLFTFFLFLLFGNNISYQVQGENKFTTCDTVAVSEKAVIQHVLSNYSSIGRPRKDANALVLVTVAFRLAGIQDFGWMDEYLQWAEDFPYNCVGQIFIPSEMIWLPDFSLSNSQGDVYSALTMSHARLSVYSNGGIYHAPNGRFEIYCMLQLYLFPFDSQICKLIFRSWTIPSDLIWYEFYEKPGNPSFKKSEWVENHVWAVDERDFKYFKENASKNYQEVIFQFKLRRKPLFYYVNFIMPSVIISVVEISTFALPIDSTEKLHISITCLLAYSVFQTTVVTDLPKTSDTTPLLCNYISLQSVYIAMAILSNALILQLLGESFTLKRVPPSIEKISLFFGMLLRIRVKSRDRKASTNQLEDGVQLQQQQQQQHQNDQRRRNSSQSSVSSARQRFRSTVKTKVVPVVHFSRRLTWHFVAKVIDKLTMYFYMSATVLTPLVMFTIFPGILSAMER